MKENILELLDGIGLLDLFKKLAKARAIKEKTIVSIVSDSQGISVKNFKHTEPMDEILVTFNPDGTELEPAF